MHVRLRELTDDELPTYFDEVGRFYVNDLVHHGGLTEAQARAKAERDHAQLFPGGRPKPGHHLFKIEDAESGDDLGRVWFAERDDGVVFLYQIELRPEARGRGLGREAMRVLEGRARELGATRLELNVFGGNEVARGLYRSLGFVEQAVYMGKEL